MVQFDMLGWPMDITTPIGLTEDYVSPELSAFVGTLTTTYSALTWEASDPPPSPAALSPTTSTSGNCFGQLETT